LIGAGLLAAGFLYPGPKKDVIVTVLVLAGAGMLPIGVLLPRLSELEIGPAGFRTKLTDDDTEFRPIFNAEAPRLNRFAKFMCGNASLARELVEEALARTREQQRAIPRADRGVVALRTLIELLETVGERRWLRGRPGATRRPRGDSESSDPDRAVAEALAGLDFFVRVAFILKVDWPLTTEEVAAILNRPLNAVREDIGQARAQLKPYVDESEGS
jgi:DNA-directed RNA polymerase specialized sigma24 family protein